MLRNGAARTSPGDSLDSKVAPVAGQVGAGLADEAGEGLRVVRPELPPFTPWTEEVRARFKKTVAEFEDTDVSNASAPFVSFKPFTCAFGRPFFQGGLMILAGNCMVLVLCLTLPFSFLDTILGRRKLFLTSLAVEQHAGCMSVIVVLITTSVIMAYVGHPGKALKVFGICPLLVCVSYGVLSAISFAESDVLLAIFWICWIIAASFIGYTTLINERAWFTSFCGMGGFSLPASLAIFVDRQPLMALVFFGFGLLFSGMAIVARAKLKRTLAKAIEATRQDRERYEAVWAKLLSNEEDELLKLAKYVKEHTGQKFLQPSDNIEALYEFADNLHGWYQEVVKRWAAYLGVRAESAPVKSLNRTLEKVRRSYAGRVPMVIDLVRASIVVDTIAEAVEILDLVLNDCQVHIVKNRLDPAYDARETFGYRDLNLQISFSETHGTIYDRFVFELQIHVKEIIAQKHNDGHRRYIEVRNLMGS